jgi:rubrerythrin
MTIDEAILKALDYERRVLAHFKSAAEGTSHPQAKKFFELMAQEEQGHVAYLEAKLEQWRAEGKIQVEAITTIVHGPVPTLDRDDPPELATKSRDYAAVTEYLYASLQLEHEVTDHYRELISSVDHPESEAMFRRFLEIEDGHTAMVQAEIDAYTKTGYFFEFQEFNMDG